MEKKEKKNILYDTKPHKKQFTPPPLPILQPPPTPFKKYIYHESHTHLHTLKYTHNIPKETLGITSGFFTNSPGALSVFLEKKVKL